MGIRCVSWGFDCKGRGFDVQVCCDVRGNAHPSRGGGGGEEGRGRIIEVEVQVLGAKNLPSLTNALEGGRGPRLYLVLKLGNQVATTRLVKASKHPQWEEEFIFRVKREDFDNRKKEHLIIDLYTCNAHLDRADTHMATAVKDGPSLASLGPAAHGEEDGSNLSTSIPMPIRSLGRTVVLLASEDAAPLRTLESGESLPLQWVDIIPRSGQARASKIPLFTLGQLGVKVFIRSKESPPPGLSEPASDSDAAREEEGALDAPSTSPAEVQGVDPQQDDEVDSPSHAEEKEGGKDAPLPVINNMWKPPSRVDWVSISRALEQKELPDVAIPHKEKMDARFGQGRKGLYPSFASPSKSPGRKKGGSGRKKSNAQSLLLLALFFLVSALFFGGFLLLAWLAVPAALSYLSASAEAVRTLAHKLSRATHSPRSEARSIANALKILKRWAVTLWEFMILPQAQWHSLQGSWPESAPIYFPSGLVVIPNLMM